MFPEHPLLDGVPMNQSINQFIRVARQSTVSDVPIKSYLNEAFPHFWTTVPPIMMAPSPEVTLEICENERAWIGGGFSSKGLLPNDRKRFSSRDGSYSYGTTSDASKGLLTRGWRQMHDFDVASDWLYARDFSRNAIAKAQSKRNIAFHWVRFRRWSCPIQLNPKDFCDEQMIDDHVDSMPVQTLSKCLLDVMTYLSLLAQPSDTILEDRLMIPIKTNLLKLIDIPNERHTFSSASVRLDHMIQILTNVAIEERRLAKYLLSNTQYFEHRTKEPLWKDRTSIVRDKYWSEGTTIATWIIRCMDPDGDYHCGNAQHDSCDLTWETCPNPGCSMIMSRKHLDRHKETMCDYTILTCECGESVPKHGLQKHWMEACILRDTNCPFQAIGCTKVLQARQVEHHVTEATDAHLLLAMNRIVEIQTVVRQLNTSLKALQEENVQLKANLEQVEKRSAANSKALDKSLNQTMKRVSGLESKTQKEFKNIRNREKRSHEQS